MKLIIIINFLLALFFLLASLKFLKEEIFDNNSNKAFSKANLINYEFIKLVSCSIICLFFFANSLYLGLLGQAFFISTGIQSFFLIVKNKTFNENYKILLVAILSITIAYLSKF